MSDAQAAPMPPSEYLVDRKGERLDSFLARRIPSLTRSAAQRLVERGLVRVDGALERASFRLGFGAAVEVWPEELSATLVPAEAIPLDILYEDSALIVIDKPAGLTVHPAPGQQSGTLVNALLAHCPELRAAGEAIRPGVVHRLDRNTSGVMMVAKHERALQHLQDQIRRRTVEKRYLAAVAGVPDPEAGLIDAPIGRDPSDPVRMAIVEGGRPSRTEYRLIERFVDASLVEARLITGRTHQIRVHMTAIGHPIIGDATYGHRSDAIDRQALHAAVLGFRHPESEEALRFEAPPPPDFAALLATLRERAPLHGPDTAGADTVAAADPPGRRRLTRHRARHIR